MALVQQLRLGMHRLPQCFLPAGQWAAPASPRLSRPTTEPSRPPRAVRRELRERVRASKRLLSNLILPSGLDCQDT